MMTHVVSVRLTREEVQLIRKLAKANMITTSAAAKQLIQAAMIMRHEYTKIARINNCQMCLQPEIHPIHMDQAELQEEVELGIRTPTG